MRPFALRLAGYSLLATALLTAAVFFAYIGVRYYKLDSQMYRWMSGEDARDTQWNRSDRHGGALGLTGYRMDIDARVVPGIDKNLSGLAFDTDHDRLIAVVNRPATLYTLDRNGEPTGRYPLRHGPDIEGVAYLGNNRVALLQERKNTLHIVTLPAQPGPIDMDKSKSLRLDLFPGSNAGFEGVGYDAGRDQLYLVKEHSPSKLYRIDGLHDADPAAMTLRLTDLSTWIDGSLPATDLSSVEFVPGLDHLLLLSDESYRLMELDRDGRPVSYLDLRSTPFPHTRVPQAEGMAIGPDRTIYVVSEPNLFYRLTPPAVAGNGNAG